MANENETVAEAEVPSVKVSQGAAITVITNTVESVRAHYPKLVIEIENSALDKAKPEWQKAERERLAALNAAFADDPKFANESFVAGLTVDQAKAKRHDDLVARLAEANAKIEKAREEVPFSATDSQAETAAESGAEPLSKIEADARAKWNKDTNIEAEFGDFKTFMSYEKNKGNTRVLTRDVTAK